MSNRPWVEISINQLNQAKTAHALMQAAYQVEARLIGAESLPPLRRSVEDIMNSESAFYGSFENKKLVGLIEFCSNKTEVAVHSLVVCPACFGQGIATKILTNLITTSKGKTIKVSTARLNCPAVGLYKKLGFKEEKKSQTSCGIKLVELALKAM